MDIIDLPKEILLKIILSARAGDDRDGKTLINLMCCRYLRKLVQDNINTIIEHYTIKIFHGSRIMYLFNGKFHRGCDLPAIIHPRYEKWYKFGRRHRGGDKPAVVRGDHKRWYHRGRLHRDDDKAAVITPNRMKWCQDGVLHRDGDKPAIVYQDGKQAWYQNGYLHRDGDQPAVIQEDGTLEYWKHGIYVKTRPSLIRRLMVIRMFIGFPGLPYNS